MDSPCHRIPPSLHTALVVRRCLKPSMRSAYKLGQDSFPLLRFGPFYTQVSQLFAIDASGSILTYLYDSDLESMAAMDMGRRRGA
jgi:hypothetical protein